MKPDLPCPWPVIACRALLAGAAITLAGCVTVNEPRVVQPSQAPDISPALLAPSGNTLKRKVVIARFSNETMYGKSVLLGGKGSLIGKKTSDILATRLARSKKFLLFHRTDSKKLLAALDAGALADLGLPADYLIIGSLSEFGRNTTGETGFLSRSKKQQAYAKVNIRLIEVATSRVIYAEEGAGEAFTEAGTVMGMGSKAGYDSTLGEKAISVAISKLVSNIIENLMAQPWRSYILLRTGDQGIIAGGAAQGLKTGDRLLVWRKGKVVTNPQTKLAMELPGKKIGVIEVVSQFGNSPTNQGSYCRIISGNLPDTDFSAYFVAEEK